ncbi:MAG: hypothetical protein CBE24_03040 [bacterium TMED264]|nr:MAG: hypothetical protein CBE24_03040 [bacterium TMED264]
MQCILSALKSESQPFIKFYNLEKDRRFSFPVFRNEDLYLLGIGMGKKYIEKRVNVFFQKMEKLPIQFINIGLAGGKKSIHTIGDIFIINKIRDENSNKFYFPDILYKHSYKESGITTVCKEITNGGAEFSDLVDMEASEIFKVCSKLSSAHNLIFIKIVSDYMDKSLENFGKNHLSTLMKSNIEGIATFIKNSNLSNNETHKILNDFDEEWLAKIIRILRLTKTQSLLIEKYFKGKMIRDPSYSYSTIPVNKPKSKFERNQIFKKICELLTA